MPVIRVEMFAGRTRDQKRALVRELTDALVRTCGGNPQSVHVVISMLTRRTGDPVANSAPTSSRIEVCWHVPPS